MGKLIVVMATDESLGCASHGRLPWNRPADGKWFKELTEGKVVVMGGKTFDEIVAMSGGPLVNRHNIVLCRKERPVTWLANHSLTQMTNIDQFWDWLHRCLPTRDVYLIGGQETINLLQLYLTIDEVFHTVVHRPVDHEPNVKLHINGFDLNDRALDKIVRQTTNYTVYHHCK